MPLIWHGQISVNELAGNSYSGAMNYSLNHVGLDQLCHASDDKEDGDACGYKKQGLLPFFHGKRTDEGELDTDVRFHNQAEQYQNQYSSDGFEGTARNAQQRDEHPVAPPRLS